MKNDKINILNALNLRKTEFPAAHFKYIKIDKLTPTLVKNLDNWIYNNLNGRYYIGPCILLQENSIIYGIQIGFEIEKEISFFKIACPHM